MVVISGRLPTRQLRFDSSSDTLLCLTLEDRLEHGPMWMAVDKELLGTSNYNHFWSNLLTGNETTNSIQSILRSSQGTDITGHRRATPRSGP